MTQPEYSGGILWMEAEPARFQRDLSEIAEFAPSLEYQAPLPDSLFLHGGWVGRLPTWPFHRPEPVGLRELIGEDGACVAVVYSAAHPVVPPRVFPNDPKPTIEQRTQSAWHVAPDGSLCLQQSQGAWQPEASITELLEKAAGWRIEYALMQAGLIDCMSERGIAVDGSRDHLITETLKAQAELASKAETHK